MEYRLSENFVEEVRLVENIVAIGRIVICGSVERRLGRIDRAGQRNVSGINVLIEFQILGEHRRVACRQSVSEIVVDERHRLLHGGLGAVQIGIAEKRRQIPTWGKWSRRIEARG